MVVSPAGWAGQDVFWGWKRGHCPPDIKQLLVPRQKSPQMFAKAVTDGENWNGQKRELGRGEATARRAVLLLLPFPQTLA